VEKLAAMMVLMCRVYGRMRDADIDQRALPGLVRFHVTVLGRD